MAVPSKATACRVDLRVMQTPYPRLKTLRKLLFHLSEDDYQAAEERFWRFIEIARRIERRKTAQHQLSRDQDSTKPEKDSRV